MKLISLRVGIFIISVIFLFSINKTITTRTSENITIFRIEKKTNYLKGKKVKIGKELDKYKKISIALNMLKNPEENFDSIGLERIEYKYEIIDELVVFDFNNNYRKLDHLEEINLIGGLVNTLVSIEGISAVEIKVNGEKEFNDKENNNLELNKNNVLINPIISPNKIVTKNIKLYFQKENDNSLYKEERSINYNYDSLLESYILEQVIAGSKGGKYISYISPNIEILSVQTEGKTCFIDLSADFIDDHIKDTYKEKKTIYSIVNSITDLDYIEEVQFLIDTKKYPIFFGDINLVNSVKKNDYIKSRIK